jgi:hypothetical protein
MLPFALFTLAAGHEWGFWGYFVMPPIALAAALVVLVIQFAFPD